jgi:hypothetical protein
MKIRSPRRLLSWTLAATGLVLAVCTGGCGTSTTDPSVIPPNTETFTGTLAVGGRGEHTFTVGGSGTLNVTLTTLDPQTTITMGLGIGQPTTTGSCGLLSYTESAHLSRVVTGQVNAGTFCVAIYDVGNIVETDTYTLTVAHF